MSDDNLRALRVNDINPHIVLQSLQKNVDEIHEMFVVTFTDDGPQIYATGDLSLLSLASLCLHDLALKSLNGELHEETPAPTPEFA